MSELFPDCQTIEGVDRTPNPIGVIVPDDVRALLPELLHEPVLVVADLIVPKD